MSLDQSVGRSRIGQPETSATMLALSQFLLLLLGAHAVLAQPNTTAPPNAFQLAFQQAAQDPVQVLNAMHKS